MPSKDKLYTNIEISQYLQDIATAYEIKKKNFFRINSYQNAADIILTYPNSVQEIWKNNPKNLDNIPSIGPHILKKIDFLLRYNIDHPDVTKAFKGIHPSVFTFTKINGIGPKIAYLLSFRGSHRGKLQFWKVSSLLLGWQRLGFHKKEQPNRLIRLL